MLDYLFKGFKRVDFRGLEFNNSFIGPRIMNPHNTAFHDQVVTLVQSEFGKGVGGWSKLTEK